MGAFIWPGDDGGGGGGGNGIEFGGADPVYAPHNVGEWLNILLTGNDPSVSPALAGLIRIISGYLFLLDNTEGPVRINAGGISTGTYAFELEANGPVKLATADDSEQLEIDAPTAVTGKYVDVTTNGGDADLVGQHYHDTSPEGRGIILESDNGAVEVVTPAGTIVSGGTTIGASLNVGSSFILYDNTPAPLLKVTEDGTYHIRTGATWVADL